MGKNSWRPGVWRACAGVWSALVLIGSVVPVSPKLSADHLDKFGHMGEYVLLAWLLVPAWHATGRKVSRALWVSCAQATLFGALIEVLQAFLPWRSCDWADALANTLGAVIGVMVWRVCLRSPKTAR